MDDFRLMFFVKRPHLKGNEMVYFTVNINKKQKRKQIARKVLAR